MCIAGINGFFCRRGITKPDPPPKRRSKGIGKGTGSPVPFPRAQRRPWGKTCGGKTLPSPPSTIGFIQRAVVGSVRKGQLVFQGIDHAGVVGGRLVLLSPLHQLPIGSVTFAEQPIFLPVFLPGQHRRPVIPLLRPKHPIPLQVVIVRGDIADHAFQLPKQRFVLACRGHPPPIPRPDHFQPFTVPKRPPTPSRECSPASPSPSIDNPSHWDGSHRPTSCGHSGAAGGPHRSPMRRGMCGPPLSCPHSTV